MRRIPLAICLLAIATPASAQYGIWSATMTVGTFTQLDEVGYHRGPSTNGRLSNNVFQFQGVTYTVRSITQTGDEVGDINRGIVRFTFTPPLALDSDLARMNLSANGERLSVGRTSQMSGYAYIGFDDPGWRWSPGERVELVLARPLVPPWAEAAAELHRSAVVVCGVLAGFAMASAYTNRRREGQAERLSATCLDVAAMAFLTVFCVSAVFLTTFTHYKQLAAIDPNMADDVMNTGPFSDLYTVNLFVGLGGMVALLVALGSSGFVRSIQHGFLTALLAVLAFGMMAYSVGAYVWSALPYG